jgi:integrase
MAKRSKGCHQSARRIFQGANLAVRDLIAATGRSPRANGCRRRALSLPEVVRIGSSSPRTLRNFLLKVYAPRRLADCKPSPRGDRLAIDSHMRSINALCAFRGCEVTLDQLSDELLEEFALWSRRSGRSPCTVNNRVATLCALWRFAWKKKHLETIPRDVEKLRAPLQLPEAWTPEEVGRLIASAAAERGHVGDVPAPVFWVALLLTLFDTGARVMALLETAPRNLDLQSGFLVIDACHQKQLKTQAFRLHPDTLRALARLPLDRELLFQTHFTRISLYRALRERFRRIVERAGIRFRHGEGFHKLRRTHATCVADVAGDEAAQRQLGHSTPSLTRRSYIDPRLLTRKEGPASLIRRPSVEGILDGLFPSEGEKRCP